MASTGTLADSGSTPVDMVSSPTAPGTSSDASPAPYPRPDTSPSSPSTRQHRGERGQSRALSALRMSVSGATVQGAADDNDGATPIDKDLDLMPQMDTYVDSGSEDDNDAANSASSSSSAARGGGGGGGGGGDEVSAYQQRAKGRPGRPHLNRHPSQRFTLTRSASFTDGMTRVHSNVSHVHRHASGIAPMAPSALKPAPISPLSPPASPRPIGVTGLLLPPIVASATTAAGGTSSSSVPQPKSMFDVDAEMQLRHSRTHKFLTALSSAGGIVGFMRKQAVPPPPPIANLPPMLDPGSATVAHSSGGDAGAAEWPSSPAQTMDGSMGSPSGSIATTAPPPSTSGIGSLAAATTYTTPTSALPTSTGGYGGGGATASTLTSPAGAPLLSPHQHLHTLNTNSATVTIKLPWEDATLEDLAIRATSASCRNFFKSRAADELATSSSSSSDGDSGDASSSSSSSSRASGPTENSEGETKTTSMGSDDMKQCADGRPKSVRQITALVKPGRTLPMRFVASARGRAVAWTTLIVDVDRTVHSAQIQSAIQADDDDDDVKDLVERSQWLHYSSWIKAFRSPSLLRELVLRKSGAMKEMAYRSVVEKARKLAPVELDPYYLDDPSIVGELRLKRVNLPSYCSSIIVYADHTEARAELDQKFFYRHPDCERRGIGLTTIRRIKRHLLAASLDHASPLDISTTVHAVSYFERLVVSGFVDSSNRRVVASVCLLLATKFYESGIVKRSEMQRKVQYVVSRMEDAFGIDDGRTIFAWELKVYVALEFNLMLEEKTGLAYLVALLATRNLSPVDFFGARSDSDGASSDSDDASSKEDDDG